MKRFALTALTGLLIFSSCKKSGSGGPSSIGEDHILTSFRVVTAQGDNTYQFTLDANDRPTVVRNLSQGTTIAGSATFSYNGQGQLEKTTVYQGEPTGAAYETIEYNYNGEGQLISDYTTNGSGNCALCEHEYEYDDEGRISSMKLFNSFYRLYEYDDDGNAVQTYMRLLNSNTETLELEFVKYDKLAPYIGVDSTMRTIIRSMFWSSVFWSASNPWTNTGEFPIPAMANNVTHMKWNPIPSSQSVSLKRDLTASYEYNEDGYPTKAVVKFSKQFEGSAPVEWTVYMTYKKVQ